MKKWQHIEKSMKMEVDARQMTPPVFVWGNIENELDKNKDRPKFLWIMWGVLALLISIAGFSYFLNQDFKVKEKLTGVSLESSQLSANVEQSEMKKNTVLFNESQKETSLAVPTTSEEEAKTTPKPQKRKAQLVKQTNIVGNQFVDKATTTHSIALPVVKEAIVSKSALAKIVDGQSALTRNMENISLLASDVEGLSLNRKIPALNNNVECPTFSRNRNRLVPFVEASAIAGRPFKKMDSDDPSSLELLDARNASESEWYLWGGNVIAGLNFSRNIYAGAGLEFTQAKERFYTADESLVKVVITYDVNTGLPIDTSFVSGNQIEKGEIRYNSVDLPIILGYHQSVKNWEFGVEASLILNMSFKVEGKMFNNALNLSRVENESNVYKENIGLGYRASFVARRFLRNGYSFHIKPSYKTSFGDIHHDSYRLQTQMKQLRLDVGIRKDF